MTPIDLTTIPVEQLLAAVNERYNRLTASVRSATALVEVAEESLAQAIADRDTERARAEAAEQELRDLQQSRAIAGLCNCGGPMRGQPHSVTCTRAEAKGEAGPATCEPCAAHYGDGGQCDEGKPVASPHRILRAEVRE